MDTQRLIAELDAERSRSQRLELQIGALLEQVGALTQKVAELTERLGQSSRNAHRPPSSDPPGTAGKSGSSQRPKSERPRGGQRGHRGAGRALVAADKVDDVVTYIRPSVKTAPSRAAPADGRPRCGQAHRARPRRRRGGANRRPARSDVVKAAAVREQLPDRDRRRACVGELRLKPGRNW